MPNIFAQIVRGEVKADIVYQDDLVTAFRDINPLAPVHILIVPNETIVSLNELRPDQEAAAGRMLRVAADLAKQEGVAADGYRLIINCGEHGGQEVMHLHLHLMGGRPLGPMLLRPGF